jgi:hypothetical protein
MFPVPVMGRSILSLPKCLGQFRGCDPPLLGGAFAGKATLERLPVGGPAHGTGRRRPQGRRISPDHARSLVFRSLLMPDVLRFSLALPEGVAQRAGAVESRFLMDEAIDAFREGGRTLVHIVLDGRAGARVSAEAERQRRKPPSDGLVRIVVDFCAISFDGGSAVEASQFMKRPAV